MAQAVKKIYKVTCTEAGSKKKNVKIFLKLPQARAFGLKMSRLGLFVSLENNKGVTLPL